MNGACRACQTVIPNPKFMMYSCTGSFHVRLPALGSRAINMQKQDTFIDQITLQSG